MSRHRDTYVDHYAPAACTEALNRPRATRVRYDADPLDDACPARCTPIYLEDGWHHDPACPACHLPLPAP